MAKDSQITQARDALFAQAAQMAGLALDFDGHVAILTLARPEKRNALQASFWHDFPTLVRGLDGLTRALVIVAEGPVFCAGMDLNVLANLAPSSSDAGMAGAHLRGLVNMLQDTFNVLAEARFPVLVGIQGACIGAGLDMISACDIRHATLDARFVLEEINIGMVADVGTFPRAVDLLPASVLRTMAYSGMPLLAPRAHDLGFVSEIHADIETMRHELLALAQVIAQKSPLAVYGSKHNINYARDHSIKDSLDYIATWQAGHMSISQMMAIRAAKMAHDTGGKDADLPDLPPIPAQI